MKTTKTLGETGRAIEALRRYIRETPELRICKWSIRKRHGYCIDICLLAAPFDAFADGGEARGENYNHYHHMTRREMTPECANVMRKVSDFIGRNFIEDHSEPMIDYFDRNIYDNYSIGKWDLPHRPRFIGGRAMREIPYFHGSDETVGSVLRAARQRVRENYSGWFVFVEGPDPAGDYVLIEILDERNRPTHRRVLTMPDACRNVRHFSGWIEGWIRALSLRADLPPDELDGLRAARCDDF